MPTASVPATLHRLGGASGEVAEGHEAGRVEAERQRVPQRGEPVDVLQHERRSCQVGEERGVQESLVEHGAEEDPVPEQRAEVVDRLPEPAARALTGRQRLAEHERG